MKCREYRRTSVYAAHITPRGGFIRLRYTINSIGNTRQHRRVAAFSELMQHAFAISGTAHTFEGRPRRITPHWWMVTQPYVDLFVSYHNADKLWVRRPR